MYCAGVVVCDVEYTEVTGSEALPLGTYFQDHVRSLVDSNERKVHKQFALLRNVVRQLGFVTIAHTSSLTNPMLNVALA